MQKKQKISMRRQKLRRVDVGFVKPYERRLNETMFCSLVDTLCRVYCKIRRSKIKRPQPGGTGMRVCGYFDIARARFSNAA